ncbi:MAG: Do family serine endopeptidase [Lamprobacter sp.]|uniref:Do family serine endopeptidase n=1 Tax=Lamprobacter sp. TaxID=3100796 RepID=UPI002B261288|nr:Do family serine endopeptidase [Lamprobacter sp.]MEA3639033.1 Do family serine endopeptidase [Lamprobacter sp.]
MPALHSLRSPRPRPTLAAAATCGEPSSNARSIHVPTPFNKIPMARFSLALLLLVALLAPRIPYADTVPSPLNEPAGPTSFADVVERVIPAVVNVTVAQEAQQRLSMPGGQMPDEGSPLYEFFKRFGGLEQMPMPRQREGEGSGFIIDAEGHIVTNHHVVDGASRIEVTLNGGDKYEAKVIGRDAKTDLALLKIDTQDVLPYVNFGDSGGARVGDWVLAVGNPFGLGGSVNAGIISARGRDINSGPYDDYIQIDAPINRGNSGGPLFDARGVVIGVNTAIFSPSGGNIGIGFAIPAETAAEIVADLKTKGRVDRGWLGVQIQPVTEEIAASLGLTETRGVLVADVIAGTPAEAAGIISGDVILQANGERMEEYRDLTKLIAAIDAGTEIDIVLYRAGQSLTIPVTIGEMPSEEMTQAARGNEPAGDEPRIGLTLAPLTPELRAERGLGADASGVLVAKVAPGSQAQAAGIKAGSLISMVGQQPVTQPSQVMEAVKQAAAAQRPSVLLRVEQAGEQRFIAVPIE